MIDTALAACRNGEKKMNRNELADKMERVVRGGKGVLSSDDILTAFAALRESADGLSCLTTGERTMGTICSRDRLQRIQGQTLLIMTS